MYDFMRNDDSNILTKWFGYLASSYVMLNFEKSKWDIKLVR